MAPTDGPPVSRVGGLDENVACVLACPPSFAAQVRWLLLVSRPERASREPVVPACHNLRMLEILAAAVDFPLLSGPTGARALAGVQIFRLQTLARRDLSAADFVRVVDGLVRNMPALRDLTLGHSSGSDPTSSEEDSTTAFPHISRLALQRYEIPNLFVHAGLPLLGSQDCLRELRITLWGLESAAAYESLLDVLERVTLRRLRHLVLVNAGSHLHADLVLLLLEACPVVRTLELSIRSVAPDPRDRLDTVLLRISGLGISALHLSCSMHIAKATFKALVVHVERMRMLRLLVLKCVPASRDPDGKRLIRTCRLRRISFIHKPDMRVR